MNLKKAISRLVWPLLLLLLLLWLALSLSAKAQNGKSEKADVFPAHIDTALAYFGPKELQRENHGPDVKRFLASVGLGEGYPYCAAFNSFCLEQSEAEKPRVRSALSQDFITDNSIDAKKVLRGQVTIPAGSIHIMPKGETMKGHTGFVLLEWSGRTGIVIDANTGLGLSGQSERDGQGVWIRQRQIYSSCYFCIDKFTLVKYKRETADVRR